MRSVSLLAFLMITPAFAQDLQPRISVMGSATVTTPPDRAQINFVVHGEGATSDEAVTVLVAKRKAIEAGLARFGKVEASASRLDINEVRAPGCTRTPPNAPRLATGDCAIVGYTANMQMMLRTSGVADAGTIVGLIGRQGGTNPYIDRFSLSDDGDAQRRATAAAIADARRQAEALAAGAGVKLGPILSVGNVGAGYLAGQDIVVTASAVIAPSAPPPPPPIVVDLHPRPIETQARVTIVYAIAR